MYFNITKTTDLSIYKAPASDGPDYKKFSASLVYNSIYVIHMHLEVQILSEPPLKLIEKSKILGEKRLNLKQVVKPFKFKEEYEINATQHGKKLKVALTSLKAHYKNRDNDRSKGNLGDIEDTDAKKLLDKWGTSILVEWYHNYYCARESMNPLLHNRHSLPNPLTHLTAWKISLIKGRIYDLFKTEEGFNGHLIQVQLEMSRLAKAMLSSDVNSYSSHLHTINEIFDATIKVAAKTATFPFGMTLTCESIFLSLFRSKGGLLKITRNDNFFGFKKYSEVESEQY